MNETQILKFEIKTLEKQVGLLWKHIKELKELKGNLKKDRE